MAQRIVHWFAAHRTVNFLLVMAYVLFVLFAHDLFVQFSVGIMNGLSIPVYEKWVAALAAVAGATLLVMVLMALRSGRSDSRSRYFFPTILTALTVHFFAFTELNIELIHALQYGLLSVLIFPLMGRYGAAALLCLPVMLVDEWLQYQVLYPDWTHYFDLNDILLDLWGAGLAVSLLGLFGIRTEREQVPLLSRVEVRMLLMLLPACIILLACCVVVFYPELQCDHTWLVMSRVTETEGFWRVHPLTGNSYHMLSPLHGLLAVLAVCVAYLGMDRNSR